ncbi:unnamed protein product [Prorocentrum cordatum]|uniref:Fe2OG dioxygenase domain-containing protein n=1 Tax=Prorocentrum cordatum TaxID=2364126 RepID=A0ABN9RM00_9DINO|nr:unnamed protein product [Polarella glacialis]
MLVEAMTVQQAKAKCEEMPECAGFTFAGRPTAEPVTVHFKRAWILEGEGWTSYRRAARPEDSHPAHADNCFRRGAGCAREAPFFHWRSHSAILFLHGPESGDFSGGDFFFTPDWESEGAARVRVVPKAGRLVAFTAGEENIHGVEEVTNGTRCALAIWLTLDAELAEHRDELRTARSLLAAHKGT